MHVAKQTNTLSTIQSSKGYNCRRSIHQSTISKDLFASYSPGSAVVHCGDFAYIAFISKLRLIRKVGATPH